MNNNKQMAVFKNYTEILMNALIKNNINGTESKLYETQLLSILLSNENNKEQDISIAIKNNLTIVNFKQCEDFLKSEGYLAQNETLYYSKVDWNAAIKSNINENTTNTTSVSHF